MKSRAVVVLIALSTCGPLFADDWPTYRCDEQRSGISNERLAFPLATRWVFKPGQEPRPAWSRPFRNNPYSGTTVTALLTFDRAFHTVAVGDAVYFGSSADHQVYCLDAATGHVRWIFFTEGPVRNTPVYDNGRLYVGSDDGRIYCLAAETGKLLWRYRVGPSDDRLPGNEQIISRWPIRTGVVVDQGVAYAAAGLFPAREGAYLCAVHAETGKQIWKQRVKQTTQGYLLATPSRLFVPSGKLAPGVYDRQDGVFLGTISNPRGNFALVANDVFISGPSISGGSLGVVSADNASYRIGMFQADHAVVHRDAVYLLGKNELQAVSRSPLYIKRLSDRKAKLVEALSGELEETQRRALDTKIASLDQRLTKLQAAEKAFQSWQQVCHHPHALIMAGNVLFAGGDSEVAAFDAASGKKIWKHEVNGKAHGLAVANGNLLVSTDSGDIHCFSADRTDQSKTVTVQYEQPVSDVSDSASLRAVEKVISLSPDDRGMCLVLGAGDDGQLAQEIATRTNLTVVCVDDDADRVAAARGALDRVGLYGRRVVVHQVSLDALPYPRLLFNLIVSEQTIRTGALPDGAELVRVLRPYGLAVVGQPSATLPGGLSKTKLARWLSECGSDDGVVQSDDDGRWAVIRRGRLAGSGDWTHQYATTGNTACSEDQLINQPLRLQWFGKPGPYRMFDRHSYTTAPVACRGRVFTLGERILYGNDAYNGTLLWQLELPDLEPRVNIPRDCGFMAANDEFVFLAASDKCLRIAAATGLRTLLYELPAARSDHAFDWGYVAIEGNVLYGSAVRQGSFYTDGRGPWYDDSGFAGPQDSLKVLSDTLFAVDQQTRNILWRYDGVVINSTLVLGGGRIYFVENRHPEVIANPSRRLAGADQWMNLQIVALDAQSGDKIWEKDVQYENRTPVMFTCYKDEVLTVLRSWQQFDLRALDARTGDQLWAKQHKWESDNHGAHRRHPVIIGGEIYQQPYAYDLKTGEQKWSTTKYGVGGNCGTLSASSSVLFSRLGNYPGLIDLSQDTAPTNLVEVTRPGCWINIIPAGGMILVPEAGSGCSCEYSLHASMGFMSQ